MRWHVPGGERAGRAGEAEVMYRTAVRQAVLAHQPDPLAAGPGQLGGPGAGHVGLAIQDVPEQAHRAVQVTDVLLDQVEAGRRARLGQLCGRCGRRRTSLLSDLDDNAVSVARVQEGLLPVRAGQVHSDGLDAGRPDLGQRPPRCR